MSRSRRLIALAAAVTIASVCAATAAGAQTVAPSSTPPSPVAISPGFAFTGAGVFELGSSHALRHLDAYKTAVFVQSFFGAAVTTKVRHQRPPAAARIYRVDVTGTWNGGDELSTRSIFYASDGTHAWITPAPADTPTAKLDFWVAPDRVVSAFEGTATLVPTAGTDAVASTTTTTATPASDRSGGAGGWWWLAVVLGLIVVAALAALGLRARRRADRVSSRR